MSEPAPGTCREDLDTPALLIDLDVMEANIQKMADFFADKPAHLRPNTKTHKCPVLAQKQIDSGANGITCAKVGEAEAMVAGGIKDILIANEIIGALKIARLMRLASQADITVSVDNPQNVADLSEAAQAAGLKLKVLVEVNVGMNRCGVAPGSAAVELAQIIAQARGLEFAGITGYEGHVVFVQDFAERKQKAEEAMALLLDSKGLIERAGLEVRVVSAGGTGTYNITGTYPGVTEVEAGSYILMDGKYGSLDGLEFNNALSLLTTVVSRPKPDLVITDGGMKSITHEFGLPVVKEVPGATIFKLAEEHGLIKLECEQNLQPGDKIEIVPSHGCTTINLHNQYLGLRNGRLEAIWDITGRGRSQ
jgi:D-serine deaminase-like pyridoxal phosphate-dependent protein